MDVQASASPWVIVAGGFHQRGGMDRANAALATYLLHAKVPVHLVGHEIDPEVGQHPLAIPHVVSRPKGMPSIAERLLARRGLELARQVTAQAPAARVVVNGGNCPWPDINWVHAVHAAWPVHDHGAPWWSRYRSRRLKTIARVRERTALKQARLVIANSDATRRALIDDVGVSRDRVRTVYLGSDVSWGAVSAAERLAARTAFGLAADVPVVTFVGALGADVNKGFDTLWAAWRALVETGRWDAQLLVAGGGWRLPPWENEAQRAGLSSSVRFVGFTPRVREVLAAGDLLVSPVRYEAYGLNVHEALCRGLAVMVSRAAGVVERFDAAMSEALLPADVTADVLADRLGRWRADVDGWRTRASATAARIRQRSWTDMAADFVRLVQNTSERRTA
jgi:glycosyltransferase involved in cell wall biosynthesis